MRTVLRLFVAAFLGTHLALLFPQFASPAFLAAAAIVGWVGGALTARFRGLLSTAFSLGTALLVVTIMMVLPDWFAGRGPNPLDTIPVWADRQLLLAALPFFWFWAEAWFVQGRETRRGFERLSHAVLVVLLFWSQGPYHVTMYPHPLQMALAIAAFLAAELALAIEPTAGRRFLRPLSAVAGLFVTVLGVGFVWSLFLRYQDQSTASGGGLMKPDLFQFDFAPLIRLEDQISLGDNLVLLYREEGTPRTRYLRRMVLEEYDPSTGFSVGKEPVPVIGQQPLRFPAEGAQERSRVTQEYYLVNLDPASLLTLNQPVHVEPFARWNESSFVNAYRVESLVSSDALWLYNDQLNDGLTAEDRARYLKGGDDPEIRALARAMTAGAHTPYEKATAILLSLKDHYFYSLKPGRPGPRGPLKHFLFENKKGYCSYFAFGMTLLLRSVGVPARIAVGFVTDPNDSVLDFTPVRAYQAHAWVEVPFGPYGWLQFDPTSDTPAPGERLQFPQATDPQLLSKLIAEILQAHPHPLDSKDVSRQKDPIQPEGLWLKRGLGLLPWVVLSILFVTNEVFRWRWTVRFWMNRDARGRWKILWTRLVTKARQGGEGPEPGVTPEAWAVQKQSENLTALALLATRARYAEESPPSPDKNVRAQFRAMERVLVRRQNPLRRALVFVFPWWRT